MPTNTQEIDRLLRRKLTELPVPAASSAGWERLTNALDQDVDHGLRNALTGLADGQTADGWERLERKLDPLATSDAAVAAALNELTPTPPVGGWDALKNELDESLGAEVDTIVQHHLQKEASQTSGWAALAARLELISHRRQLVGAWKVVEVSLLASLMLLILRFGPGTKEGNDVIAALHEGFPISTVQSAERSDAATPEGRETKEDILPASENEVIHASEGRQILDRPTTPLTAPQEPAKATNLTATRARAVAILPGPTYRVEVGEHDLSPAPKTDLLTGPEYTAEWSTTLPSPALALPAIDNSIPVRYHLNIFASPTEINEVITPSSTVENRNVDIIGRSKFTHSVSAGVLLDISKGNDGLQVGVLYGRHAYTPSELIEENCFVTGECAEGFNRFIYESISFPFSYERSLFNRNDWRIATRVGMSMSVITKSQVEEPADAEVTLAQALTRGPSNGGSRRGVPENTISVDQLLDPDRGWFEGGSLLTNASFYLGGGFTIERSITPRMSFYLSPSYGRVIYLRPGKVGVGPYNDRIHRASLRFGSRFLLSRR